MAQGSAVIIPAHNKDFKDVKQKENMNEGKPIKYLISAPTMRVPYDVSDTVNSYLAFRAILRAGMDLNYCILLSKRSCVITNVEMLYSLLQFLYSI